jgi:hypothetical protein
VVLIGNGQAAGNRGGLGYQRQTGATAEPAPGVAIEGERPLRRPGRLPVVHGRQGAQVGVYDMLAVASAAQ